MKRGRCRADPSLILLAVGREIEWAGLGPQSPPRGSDGSYQVQGAYQSHASPIAWEWPSRGMMKLMRVGQGDRRKQFAFLAGHAIEATSLQYRRIESAGGEPRHDLDFYMLCLWRLREIAKQAGTQIRPLGAAMQTLLAQFDETVPRQDLEILRNWWLHPQYGDGSKLQGQWVSWFQDSIVRLLPDGGVEYMVHAEFQQAAEQLYAELVNLLELPTDGL